MKHVSIFHVIYSCKCSTVVHLNFHMITLQNYAIKYSALLGPFERNDCNEILHRLDNRDTFITIVKKVHLSVSFLV